MTFTRVVASRPKRTKEAKHHFFGPVEGVKATARSFSFDHTTHSANPEHAPFALKEITQEGHTAYSLICHERSRPVNSTGIK